AAPPAPPPPIALLRAWFDAAGFDHGWLELESRLRAAGGCATRWRVVQDEDWAHTWRHAFQRVEIDADHAVAPPWLAEEGDLVIDPGMAFGTGEHPTTRACLRAVLAHGRPGWRCLDVGSGSGVVALLAAREGMIAHGIDIEAEAVRAGEDNAARNGLRATFSQTPLADVPGTWDLVVANIYAEVLVQLMPDLAARVGSKLVLAGILADRAPLVEEALQAQGLVIVDRQQDGDWVHLIARRVDAP
ncbi:MAG: methyltransferase domain-containing protein, partial [Deltaproteobacteria bacterium]